MFVILLADLSKRLACVSHELLPVKLNAYGIKTLVMYIYSLTFSSIENSDLILIVMIIVISFRNAAA